MSKNKNTNQNEGQLIEMTQEAYDELVNEIEHRKNTLREEIADEIAEARSLGDLSENHAYTVAMEKRERNENRISELEMIVKDVQIVSAKSSSKVVTIGKKVQIKNVKSGKSREVQLDGTEETGTADPRSGKVSIDSPLGVALHNSKIGDTVEVETPVGAVEYKIEKFL